MSARQFQQLSPSAHRSISFCTCAASPSDRMGKTCVYFAACRLIRASICRRHQARVTGPPECNGPFMRVEAAS